MQTTQDEQAWRRTGDAEQEPHRSRVHSRKLELWRRLVLLFVGLLVLTALVVWQHSAVRRRECRHAFELHVERIIALSLDHGPADELTARWEQLSKGPIRPRASHYVLIADNWTKAPHAGEPNPLAVCRELHATLLSSGRHVLFRDAAETRIEWLAAEAAAPIRRLADGD